MIKTHNVPKLLNSLQQEFLVAYLMYAQGREQVRRQLQQPPPCHLVHQQLLQVHAQAVLQTSKK